MVVVFAVSVVGGDAVEDGGRDSGLADVRSECALSMPGLADYKEQERTGRPGSDCIGTRTGVWRRE